MFVYMCVCVCVCVCQWDPGAAYNYGTAQECVYVCVYV